jgi:pSer/pThr/pTyr-binding forkhead associated (FHA) protein
MPRVPQVDGPVPERRWAVELRCGDGLLRCAVPEGGLRIGRDDDNDVVLPEQSVSRQHLRIVAGEGGLVAQDLGATNPAQLNGVPLSGSARFGVGDTIDVCGTQIGAVCVG